MIVTERQSYSILDWLGDVGGLFDALSPMGAFLVGPVARIVLRDSFAYNFFYERTRSNSSGLLTNKSETR